MIIDVSKCLLLDSLLLDLSCHFIMHGLDLNTGKPFVIGYFEFLLSLDT